MLPAALGLPLPERAGAGAGAGAFEIGVADMGGGGGSTAVLCAVGDVVAGGSSELNEGLSCGAGEGAIATAVLMINVCSVACVLALSEGRCRVPKKPNRSDPSAFPEKWGAGWAGVVAGRICEWDEASCGV